MPAPIRYAHIACFIDESDAARHGLAHATALRELSGARLSVVHVVAAPGFLVSMAASYGAERSRTPPSSGRPPRCG